VQLAKFLCAGIVGDLAFLLLPAATRLFPVGALAGAMIGASWFPVALLFDRLMGMDADLALRHAMLKTASAALFGAFGGAIVPLVSRRLMTSGLIPRS